MGRPSFGYYCLRQIGGRPSTACTRLPPDGHLVQKMVAKLQERFHWPGLRSDVERYVVQCDVCATMKGHAQQWRGISNNTSWGLISSGLPLTSLGPFHDRHREPVHFGRTGLLHPVGESVPHREYGGHHSGGDWFVSSCVVLGCHGNGTPTRGRTLNSTCSRECAGCSESRRRGRQSTPSRTDWWTVSTAPAGTCCG